MGIDAYKGGRGFTPPGTGSGGSTRLWVKSTNSQPAVFLDITERDAYFVANPADWTQVSSGRFAIGLGPIAEAYPGTDNGYWVHNPTSSTWSPVIGTQGPDL